MLFSCSKRCLDLWRMHIIMFIHVYLKYELFLTVDHVTSEYTMYSWTYNLTLPHIQQFCSRQLWNYQGKNTPNFHKWRYNYWNGWKHCGKGEIACFEQFLLLSQCFQKSSTAEASESVYRWERVKLQHKAFDNEYT